MLRLETTAFVYIGVGRGRVLVGPIAAIRIGQEEQELRLPTKNVRLINYGLFNSKEVALSLLGVTKHMCQIDRDCGIFVDTTLNRHRLVIVKEASKQPSV